MKSYRELATEDLRLVILRLLSESDGYGANSAMLQMALPSFGHSVSGDQLQTQLSWLAEQGLATVETMESLRVAKLTARGLDVANGNAQAPGVKRPLPDA